MLLSCRPAAGDSPGPGPRSSVLWVLFPCLCGRCGLRRLCCSNSLTKAASSQKQTAERRDVWCLESLELELPGFGITRSICIKIAMRPARYHRSPLWPQVLFGRIANRFLLDTFPAVNSGISNFVFFPFFKVTHPGPWVDNFETREQYQIRNTRINRRTFVQ